MGGEPRGVQVGLMGSSSGLTLQGCPMSSGKYLLSTATEWSRWIECSPPSVRPCLCPSIPGLTSTVLIGILPNLAYILRTVWASECQQIDDLGQGHQGQSQGKILKMIIFTSSTGSSNQIVSKLGRDIQVPKATLQCQASCPRSRSRGQRSRSNTQK